MSATTTMTCRERLLAVLRYQPYDRLPLIHFGYWHETLAKWADEGHIDRELAKAWRDGNEADGELNALLGWDHDYQRMFGTQVALRPGFEREVVASFPDGSQHLRNGDGVVILTRPEAGSIPAEIAHLLEDRESFEAHYRHRLQWCPERVDDALARAGDFLSDERELPVGLHLGSLIGTLRNIVGVENLAYMTVDDEELLEVIVAIMADLCYRNAERVLAAGYRFDYAHFWEDICYKNGPLVSPTFFAEVIGPHYKRLSELVRSHGIDIVSVDCDGCIDALIPTWLENGVDTMFPIEVGTWRASIAPWREQYGRQIRGIGGMDKRVFALDRAAIDAEVERLAALVELGGYIPCPDHRIPPDAEWDLVRYYCERMRARFG